MIYKEIRNYTISRAPPLPQKYFDFVEKSQEELDKVTFFMLKYWDFFVWYGMTYKEIPNNTISRAPPFPPKYFDFVEKSQEELDKVTFFKLKYWEFMVWCDIQGDPQLYHQSGSYPPPEMLWLCRKVSEGTKQGDFFYVQILRLFGLIWYTRRSPTTPSVRLLPSPRNTLTLLKSPRKNKTRWLSLS